MNIRGGSEKVLVLLIEDEADLLELTQEVLQRKGFHVVTARNGEAALRLLEDLAPDVIVTDLMMPVLDGFGFLERYRAVSSRCAPVIALSGLDGYLRTARELGVARTFAKPVDLGRLVAAIRELAEGQSPSEPPSLPNPIACPESVRLREILNLRLDEVAPEKSLHRFVDLVAAHFAVPIALISVITEERQFWTAGSGIPEDLAEARGTPRRDSFCTHAVAARSALVVQDTLQNPFFHDNPLVQDRGLRFYAGVPLIARHGEAIGTLCLLDHEAKRFTHFDLELLSVFGRCALAALEQRERQCAAADIPDSAFRYLQYIDDELDIFGKQAFNDLTLVEGARGIERDEPSVCVALAVPTRTLRETVDGLRARRVDSIVGRLGHSRLGWLVRDMTAEEARATALAIGGPHAFAEAVDLADFVGATATALQLLEAQLGDAGLA